MADINFGWSFFSLGVMAGSASSSAVFKRYFRTARAKTGFLFAAMAANSLLQMAQPYSRSARVARSCKSLEKRPKFLSLSSFVDLRN